MFVREWMTENPVTIGPTVRLGTALGVMSERKVRRLPVVEKGKLVGIVTKSDLYAAMGPTTRGAMDAAEKMTVAEVMAADPQTVGPDDTLERAALFMMDMRVSGLPVVEKGKLVGIITETDLFRIFGEIMGLREGGGRILLRLADGKPVLDQIAKRVGKLGLRSVVTYRSPKDDVWHAVLRVRGRAT